MSKGNVIGCTGTGVRQFSGILSVTDISGGNIATFSSNSIVLGNTLDNPVIQIIGTVPQITIASGASAAASFLRPAQDQTLYSLLGRSQAGPGIQARWDSSSNNRYLSFGTYDNLGAYSETVHIGNTGITITGTVTLVGQITGTIAPPAGAAQALPATPSGYVLVNIEGTNRLLAYYA